jgi:hypothetical protein
VANFIGYINLFPGTIKARIDANHLQISILNQTAIAQTSKEFAYGQLFTYCSGLKISPYRPVPFASSCVEPF